MTDRRRSHWPVDWRDDRGFAGGIEALPFGVLIFVVGSLLVTNAWAVIDAKVAVTAASREATRAYVESPDGWSAPVAAQIAMTQAMAGHGRDPARSSMHVEHAAGAPFERCVLVSIEVRHPVPALSLPFIGGYGQGFEVTSTHSEVIDPFRDGLSGDGRC
jgi:hypothetical protein